MALFLCAEVSLFGLLIGTYFYLDFNARELAAVWDQGARP